MSITEIRYSTRRYVITFIAVFLTLTSSSTAYSSSNPFCTDIVSKVQPHRRTTSIPLDRRMTSAIISVKIFTDLWVGLFEENNLIQPPYTKYEFVFGGWANSKSTIGTSQQYPYGAPSTKFLSYDAPILDANNFRALWISWDGGVIAAGNGTNVGVDTFLRYVDPSPTPINYMTIGGFSNSGDVIITYCYNPRYVDRSFPVDPAVRTASMFSGLDCGHACAEDPGCKGYAVARNVKPVGNVNCSIFHSISDLIFDPYQVTYVARNATNLIPVV